MAVTADKVEVILEANTSQYMGAIKDAEQQFTSSSAKISNAATQTKNALSGQTGNLASQLNDIAVQLQSGTSPLTIALQQGTQINQVIGQAGAAGAVKALGGAFLSLLNPVSLATIGIIAATGAIIQFLEHLTGSSEAEAEAALKRQKKLIDDIADALPGASDALKEFLDEGSRATPNSIILRTQEQIDAARKSVSQLTKELQASVAGASAATPGNLIFINQDTVRQIEKLQGDFDGGRLSAERLSDELRAMELNPDVGWATKGLLENLAGIVDQLRTATTTAEAFSNVLDALRANGGPIIAGDFSQLGKDTQKAFDQFKSVVDSGISQRDKLKQALDQGLGGATSNEARESLQKEYDLAIKTLNAKDAVTSGKKADSQYTNATNSIEKQTAVLEQQTAAQAELNPLVDDYGYAVTKAATAQSLLSAAQAAGVKVTPELKEQINALAEGYANATVASNELQQSQERLKASAADFANFAEGAISGFVKDLEQGKSAAEAFSNVLDKVADKILDMSLDAAFSGLTGGDSNPFGTLIKAVFGGGKAVGGPVSSGTTYLVGEKGPELFTPGSNGTITPNSALPSATQQQSGDMNININLAGANGDQAIQDIAFNAVVQGIRAYDMGTNRRVASAIKSGRISRIVK